MGDNYRRFFSKRSDAFPLLSLSLVRQRKSCGDQGISSRPSEDDQARASTLVQHTHIHLPLAQIKTKTARDDPLCNKASPIRLEGNDIGHIRRQLGIWSRCLGCSGAASGSVKVILFSCRHKMDIRIQARLPLHRQVIVPSTLSTEPNVSSAMSLPIASTLSSPMTNTSASQIALLPPLTICLSSHARTLPTFSLSHNATPNLSVK